LAAQARAEAGDRRLARQRGRPPPAVVRAGVRRGGRQEEHVLGFQVAVHDARCVRRAEVGRQGAHGQGSLALAVVALAHQVVEELPADAQFGHQQDARPLRVGQVFKRVVQLHRVRRALEQDVGG